MKYIRFRVIILAIWLAVLFNAERLLNPIKINGFAYILILAMVVMMLVIPKLIRIPLWIMLTLPIIIFPLLKAWTGGFSEANAFALTVIEICAIISTTILTQWVSQALSEFELAIKYIMIGRQDKVTEPAPMGNGSIYREVRRARNHHRPLVMIAVAVEEKTISYNINRMIKEAQIEMMKKYRLSALSKTLCDELEDCSVIVQNNDHFLVVLPEATPEEMTFVVERIRRQAVEQVGVELKIGTSALPQDSLTFEGLVDKATRAMETDREIQQFVELEG